MAASYNSTGFVIKTSMAFLVLAAFFGILGLLSEMASDDPMWENPLKETAVLFLMFLFVGLLEELAFRAVINDAIIYKFRNWKYVFVLSAVISSLVFGAAHVLGFDTTSPMAWAQAIGKTISAGIFGLALLLLYWKTRNIWACGVVHGLYDFMASFSMGIYNNPNANKTSYVAPDEYASAVLILYSVLSVIEIIFVIFIWFKIGKKIDFAKIRREW